MTQSEGFSLVDLEVSLSAACCPHNTSCPRDITVVLSTLFMREFIDLNAYTADTRCKVSVCLHPVAIMAVAAGNSSDGGLYSAIWL